MFSNIVVERVWIVLYILLYFTLSDSSRRTRGARQALGATTRCFCSGRRARWRCRTAWLTRWTSCRPRSGSAWWPCSCRAPPGSSRTGPSPAATRLRSSITVSYSIFDSIRFYTIRLSYSNTFLAAACHSRAVHSCTSGSSDQSNYSQLRMLCSYSYAVLLLVLCSPRVPPQVAWAAARHEHPQVGRSRPRARSPQAPPRPRHAAGLLEHSR